MNRLATAGMARKLGDCEGRDASLRTHYATAAITAIPRILAAVDRNMFGPSYGCCDREYWHYRTAAFPSEMYQEAALPLALAYRYDFPGSTWQGEPRLAEAVAAILRFSAKSAHADGSGDDYYPHERALGATVFSLQAGVEAYRLLELRDAALLDFFRRRANWIVRHDESGRLTNHHALAALALWRTGVVCDDRVLRQAAVDCVRRVVSWQSSEGWWPEYGGADPGYQTVTIDCLAKLRTEIEVPGLDEALRRGVEFCRWFQTSRGAYGGEYGSRGTRHFYAHGLELLAPNVPYAAQLADGYLRSLADDTATRWDDDRMYVHRLGNLFEAYRDWSPTTAACAEVPDEPGERFFAGAGLYALQEPERQLIVSTARGGSFCYTEDGEMGTAAIHDAGLIVQFDDGHTAVSQTHDLRRQFDALVDPNGRLAELTTTGPLHFARFERATPLKQAILHFLAGAMGRPGRTLLRRLLQRRVIRAQRVAPISLERSFRRMPDGDWQVIDVICLTSARATVRGMAFASDLQAAYTAATNVYHDGLRQPWHDLSEHVERLNQLRRVEIVRHLAVSALPRTIRPRPGTVSCESV
jgi:hypothetical protein